MAKFSRKTIEKAFSDSDNAGGAVECGRLLENFIAYLFSKCSGVRHYRNNMINAAGSSEIDVCFWNNRHDNSFDFLPQILVVECKNTQEPVDSAAVRVFQTKLQVSALDYGVLVAVHGVTGNPENLRAAHDVIRTAFQAHRIRIIVLTRAELEVLRSTEELVRLLQDKVLQLTMQAQSF